jgi:hypothetical protein
MLTKGVWKSDLIRASWNVRTMLDVVADLKVMKIKRWTEKTKDREQWRLVVEKAKAHPGL